VKVVYRESASDDVVRQFRYYLSNADVPDVAIRFREAVRRTIQYLRQNPRVGSLYSSEDSRLANLRSWPVAGFEAVRIYYLAGADSVEIVPVLHSKRDVRAILRKE
jgi:toxin ParE1/3/4